VGRSRLADQQQRQVLVPGGELLEQLQGTALGLDIAEQDIEHFAAGFKLVDRLAPVAAAAGKMVFAEEPEDHRQVAATLGIIVNQEDLGFSPHLVLVWLAGWE